jgi:hypothetical protein
VTGSWNSHLGVINSCHLLLPTRQLAAVMVVALD